MNSAVQQTDVFEADVARQFERYLDTVDEALAWRFKDAVDNTLLKLSREPGLGRIRHFRHSNLQGLRSFSVDRPFNKLLVFYRINGGVLQAWRLMHGARDLPRRLGEPPNSPSHF